MKDTLARCGIRCPTPHYDARNRPTYKTEVNGPQLASLFVDMVEHKRRPNASISQFNDSTVVVTERMSGETWIFKYYAPSVKQAETTLSELLDLRHPSRLYQGTFL